MTESIRYLRTAEAAKYTSISVSSLTKQRLTGGGPPYSKLGRTVVYDRAVLDDWIAAHQCTSTSSDSGAAT